MPSISGLAVILSLFGPISLGIYHLINLGPMPNNLTLAYYLTARGRFSVKDSLMRVAKLPIVYGFILGFIFNFCGFSMLKIDEKYGQYTSGASVILGMMVGISIGKMEKIQIDLKLTTGFIFSKFIMWSVLVFFLIALDALIFKVFNNEIYQLLAPLFSHALTIAYASEHNLHTLSVTQERFWSVHSWHS